MNQEFRISWFLFYSLLFLLNKQVVIKLILNENQSATRRLIVILAYGKATLTRFELV